MTGQRRCSSIHRGFRRDRGGHGNAGHPNPSRHGARRACQCRQSVCLRLASGWPGATLDSARLHRRAARTGNAQASSAAKEGRIQDAGYRPSRQKSSRRWRTPFPNALILSGSRAAANGGPSCPARPTRINRRFPGARRGRSIRPSRPTGAALGPRMSGLAVCDIYHLVAPGTAQLSFRIGASQCARPRAGRSTPARCSACARASPWRGFGGPSGCV